MVCGCTNAIGDVGRLLGTKWKEMSDEEKKVRRLSHKQPYNDLANRDKARAEAEKAAYAVRVPAYTEQGISVGACCVFVFSTAVPGCPYRACAMDRSPSTSSVHGLYFSLILSHTWLVAYLPNVRSSRSIVCSYCVRGGDVPP